MIESKEELKNLLMRVKEESEKAVLKLNMNKLKSWHLVPSLPNRWRKSGNHDRFCSQSLQTVIAATKLLGRKAMTNLDSAFKNRDITLLTKVHIVEALIFPVVIYRYESWTIKKTGC